MIETRVWLERLRAVVGLHIVHGRQTLADLHTTTTLKTPGGEPVTISVENGDVRFGGAHILRADIACRNGQLHTLDKLVIREYSYAG